jgi:hypothetical protein
MNLASRASQIVLKISAFPWLPELLAGFAAVYYFAQSVGFAFTQWSVIDEGNYAYKGWLFATGQYVPYQDYGPWTNHMPFSFLIFGAAQLLFGPGLRTIRYFMVFVGCLLMLALWLTSRRLAGRWAAAACLWFLALNPFSISNYSVGIAEGLVACILAWILYFTLGEGRSSGELFAGSLLAAILVLTRENMVLVLPFLFLYVFWQHGKKAGFVFLGVATALLLAAHAFYWPGILRVWATWMPKNIRLLLGKWVYQGPGRLDTPTQFSFLKNLFVVFSSIRANFLAIFAVLAVWLSWPRDGFKNRSQFKIVVFLSAVFVLLYLAHGWASLTKDYCSFCLVNYVTFFSPVGILLLFAFLPGIKERRPICPAWLAGGLILLLFTGIGYSNYENLGQPLASLNIPRTNDFGQTVELWRLLANKFNLDIQDLRRLLPSLAGLLTGLLVLGVGYAVTRLGKKSPLLSSSVYALIFVIMLMGLVLSPTIALGGLADNGRCGNDILTQYEKVGTQLAQRIPAGARVYWRGDPSPTPLLYLPNIKIYPPQLNDFFSVRPPKNINAVLRYGFWNMTLDQKWRFEADVVLIRESEFSSMRAFLSSPRFEELEQTSPVFVCAPDTQIRIFKRK